MKTRITDQAAQAREDLLAGIASALRDERDPRRAMERAVAMLKNSIPVYTWVGIYLLDGDELVLGPFLGKPSPHTRIPLGSGICGAAATERKTISDDDVNDDSR
jgi:GAF domain-containing protein